MEETNFVDSLRDSFDSVVDNTVEYAPRIVVALLLVVVGLILARFISKWVAKLIEKLESSKAAQSTVKELGFEKFDISGIIRIFTYWTILLIFFSAAVDVLTLDVLTDTFNALISFVPNLLAAALIAALSFVAANAAYEVVFESAKKSGIKAHKVLALASKIAVLVFGLPLAATQLGLDLTIITNNLTVIIGGVMLALGIAFGLGGKDVAGKLVDDVYKNWKK